MSNLSLGLGFLLVLGVAGFTTRAQETGLSVWAVDAITRVSQDAEAQTASDIHIFAARGEYESFQVVASASGIDITVADFEVSPFTSANGQRIAPENVTRYREHYVYAIGSRFVNGDSLDNAVNPALGDGWYADALIPFIDSPAPDAEFQAAPFTVRAGQSQPLWVDVFIPRDTPPGDYAATYSVTSDQGEGSGKVKLTVWDFELPEHFSSGSSFQIWNTHTIEAAIELLKHRMQPLNIDPADAEFLRDEWGLTQVGLGFWGGINWQACQAGEVIPPPPSVDEVLAEAALYPSGIQLYNQSVDEIDACLDVERNRMIEWNEHLRVANAPQAITMTPTDRLLYIDANGQTRSAVDIWVVLPSMYDSATAEVEAALERGEQVWSYAALVQDEYSPKWELDFAPINYRLMQGFINQSLGLTGFMYWAVDSWTDDPWHNVNIAPDPDDPNWLWPPGDGMLFYPGEQVGLPGMLIPSLRAKWVREGFEDYEYIQLLKDLGQTEMALQITRSVGPDWHNWTRDPTALEAARAALAGAIMTSQP